MVFFKQEITIHRKLKQINVFPYGNQSFWFLFTLRSTDLSQQCGRLALFVFERLEFCVQNYLKYKTENKEHWPFVSNCLLLDLIQLNYNLQVSMAAWHLDDFMCKFVPMFAGTNVFVSTISITAIALDRYSTSLLVTMNRAQRSADEFAQK